MVEAASPALTLVWDASPLHHAIRADRADVLGDIARGPAGAPRRNVTTGTVIDELRFYDLPTTGLGWLEVVHLDEIRELNALMRWMGVVSGQSSNQGEATVLAWADVHQATAVIDDRDARRAAREAGQEVWGSLRVIASAVQNDCLSEQSATSFVDAMVATGCRYPKGCAQGQFVAWSKANGLL
jgi:predicted nucleic acid-binding protein